ncbi:MAG: methylcrotonoyl-CoA carboxylase [Alphaproteobacteria bacterium CG_4_9_14_3_um_filter_47_13]|nr:MAG: methylcrotonoyl-CoA carboxylase [Alphaproteobacteria bacterium CG_4_9_14_3_um_filter_47_13]
MFTKILIANRGEIACRIIKTARRMGIRTVAVYSEADRKALHVRMADEAVHIGGAASAESYLRSDIILKAAQDAGAQAIHPGYGFLSENEDFARSCDAADIKFIGPSAKSINAMGLKDRAKDIMEKAGVPVVPGYRGENQEAVFLQQEANKIGFPVLIKAVAGGGGKGMRLVETKDDFAEALKSCKREARASFGNEHVLIEKYITKPRHVEMQVFGDSRGNAVHLFSRDCSLQRRHQKIIEEAPAPGLPEKIQEELGAVSVKAVKALGYENAGTIEFIMDSKTHEFFFMEMNTRLQVEHPVTEMITGSDLVEWQLRVASGEVLPLKQDEIKCNGHSFEVRLYAEDPSHEFLPQAGKIHDFFMPSARIDTGVAQGDDVTIHYDPMIAKIITHGENRTEALHKMQEALEQTGVAGLATNQEFLANIFAQKDFITADIDTGFIPRHIADLVPEHYGLADDNEKILAAVYFLTGQGLTNAGTDPWDSRDHWRVNGMTEHTLTLVNKNRPVLLTACCKGTDFIFKQDGNNEVSFLSFENRILTVMINGIKFSALIAAYNNQIAMFHKGRVLEFHLYGQGSGEEEGTEEGRIITPMPGKIVDVLVKQGDRVEKNQPLLVMEAMKMEITIRAGCAGTVEELPVSANDQVQDGALLVWIQNGDKA